MHRTPNEWLYYLDEDCDKNIRIDIAYDLINDWLEDVKQYQQKRKQQKELNNMLNEALFFIKEAIDEFRKDGNVQVAIALAEKGVQRSKKYKELRERYDL